MNSLPRLEAVRMSYSDACIVEAIALRARVMLTNSANKVLASRSGFRPPESPQEHPQLHGVHYVTYRC